MAADADKTRLREALRKDLNLKVDFFHTRGGSGPHPHFFKSGKKGDFWCFLSVFDPFFELFWSLNFQSR